nr:MAG TPA: hypothetical protein [Caudoviricetes sp.]
MERRAERCRQHDRRRRLFEDRRPAGPVGAAALLEGHPRRPTRRPGAARRPPDLIHVGRGEPRPLPRLRRMPDLPIEAPRPSPRTQGHLARRPDPRRRTAPRQWHGPHPDRLIPGHHPRPDRRDPPIRASVHHPATGPGRLVHAHLPYVGPRHRQRPHHRHH